MICPVPPVVAIALYIDQILPVQFNQIVLNRSLFDLTLTESDHILNGVNRVSAGGSTGEIQRLGQYA